MPRCRNQTVHVLPKFVKLNCSASIYCGYILLTPAAMYSPLIVQKQNNFQYVSSVAYLGAIIIIMTNCTTVHMITPYTDG